MQITKSQRGDFEQKMLKSSSTLHGRTCVPEQHSWVSTAPNCTIKAPAALPGQISGCALCRSSVRMCPSVPGASAPPPRTASTQAESQRPPLAPPKRTALSGRFLALHLISSLLEPRSPNTSRSSPRSLRTPGKSDRRAAGRPRRCSGTPPEDPPLPPRPSRRRRRRRHGLLAAAPEPQRCRRGER